MTVKVVGDRETVSLRTQTASDGRETKASILDVVSLYGLTARNAAVVIGTAVVLIILYFVYPQFHLDAIATIAGLAIAIPGLAISIRLLIDTKSASVAAREAAMRTARELAALEALRRNVTAITNLDLLKSAFVDRNWHQSITLCAGVLSQMRSVRHGGLHLRHELLEALDDAITSYEAVESRLAQAILLEQTPKSPDALFKAISKHSSFLTRLSQELRHLTKDNQDD